MSKSRNNALEFSTVGSEILDAGSAVTGKRYGALQILNDATISAITANNIVDSSKLLGVAFTAGNIIYGEISAVTVTSGVIAAHKY
jgi:hypothetical protein